MASVGEAYLQNVQATYRYYCYHVHNEGRDVEKDGYLWYPSRFHTFLCDTVQDFIEKPTDKAFEILILNTPPQHGKSLTVTQTLPSWYIMRHPDNSVIEISYGDDLAERFGKSNLEKVKKYGSLFGVNVDKKKATSREFDIAKHKGKMISKGFGSGLTGHTGHLIVIDDPIKNREEADSETKRNAIWNEFIDSTISRHQAGTKIILIMTRWHEDDLAGRIMKEYEDRTTVVNLPCEAEPNDPLGREVGEALCPEIGKDNDWLKDFKQSFASEQGQRSWNALYQGRPTAKEGNMLKREWWQYYDYDDFLNGNLKLDTMIMSVDAAFKDEKKNDYVAIQVWAKRQNSIYLVDAIKEHLNFPETLRKIRLVKARYPQTTAILIEDKANGSGIIQILKNEILGVIPVQPDASKESRVNAVSFAIEAGNVFLPKNRKFTWDFVEECAAFPNGKHDDQVDCMSQSLNRLIYSRTTRKLIREAKRGDRYFNIPRKADKSKAIGKGAKINVI